MVKDENLKFAIDYSEGQKQAAYTVLGEIVNLLNEYAEHIRIIGGWYHRFYIRKVIISALWMLMFY